MVKLPDQWAHYPDKLAPQLKQLPPRESLKGIYRFERSEDGTQRLIWCFSKNEMQPPDEFEVPPGSQRTLVTLERLEQTAMDARWAKSVVASSFKSVLAD